MTIYEQLTRYCECTEIDEKDFDEAVHILSQMTCWSGTAKDATLCNTFEFGPRKEVVELPLCLDKCGVIDFVPFYQPFDESSFTFKVARISGIEETVTEITSFAYVSSLGLFKIDLSEILPNCACAGNPCGCDDQLLLIVEYNAGYEELPDCILPVLCNMLTVIHAKNECDCDTCAPCNTANANTTVDPMTGEVHTSVQTIKYASGDIATVQLETDLARLVVDNYKRQLGFISLCHGYDRLWGTVV